MAVLPVLMYCTVLPKTMFEAHAAKMSAARGKRFAAVARKKLNTAEKQFEKTDDEEIAFPYVWESLNSVRFISVCLPQSTSRLS
jgi:hypothetical protein